MALPQTSSTSDAPLVPVPCKRGAQNDNANARKHGAYSRFNPSRLAQFKVITRNLSVSAPPIQPQTAPDVAQAQRSPLDQTLQSLRTVNLELSSIFQDVVDRHDIPLMCFTARQIAKNTGQINRHILSTHVESSELRKIAIASIALPIWQFKYYYGVTRDVEDTPPLAASRSRIAEGHEPFLTEFEKSGQKSSHAQPLPPDSLEENSWLTETQWRLVADLLPAQPLEQKRGRPSASSRAVLNAIFWKLAHGIPWSELPERFPPQRTCRRYYKRWFNSGRLLTIYKILIRDFLVRSRVHPLDFVEDGYFFIAEDKRICLTPACPGTWQLRTALLLMQESYALIRRVRREEKDPYFPRSPMLDSLLEEAFILQMSGLQRK